MALTVIEYWSLQAFPKLLVSYTLRVDFESLTIFLPSANEVCKGYVFTPVCQSFCSQGGLPHCMLDTPLGPDTPRADTPPPLPPPGTRHPLRTRPPLGPGTTPAAVRARRYGQQAGSAHPPGMHSCVT